MNAILLDPFTPEQRALRMQGIGGSDIGPVSIKDFPFRGAHDVWLDKTGRAPPREDTVDSLYGKLAEPMARQLYTLRTGRQLQLPGTLVHPDYPIVMATPDGVLPGQLTVQIKCPRFEGEWGEDGSQDIDPIYWPQITWEMAVAGVKRCDMVALIHRTIRIYPDLPFDAELFEDLRLKAELFWQKYIVEGKEPPIDGSPGTTDFLKRKYPNAELAPIEADDPDTVYQVMKLRQLKEQIDVLEAQEKAAKNALLDRIGAHEGIKGAWGKITYKNVRTGLATDWDGVRRELGPGFEDLIQRHTHAKASYRRLVTTFKK